MKNDILIILLAGFLVSCGSGTTNFSSPMPGINLPIDQMNTMIRLAPALGMKETFKQTGLMQLELNNFAEQSVAFSADLGIKIYIYREGKWEVVENTVIIDVVGGFFQRGIQ